MLAGRARRSARARLPAYDVALRGAVNAPTSFRRALTV